MSSTSCYLLVSFHHSVHTFVVSWMLITINLKMRSTLTKWMKSSQHLDYTSGCCTTFHFYLCTAPAMMCELLMASLILIKHPIWDTDLPCCKHFRAKIEGSMQVCTPLLEKYTFKIFNYKNIFENETSWKWFHIHYSKCILQWSQKSTPPPLKLFAIFSLRLNVFPQNFASMLPVNIYTYLLNLVDLS